MNTNNSTFPSFLLSRYHQHLNHLNDMAYTHTKILQEIIEKRSDQSSPPHGSITSSPSSSTSTNDTVKHKRSYPSNDNEHLNKRARKQAKPQQYVPLDANNPTSSDDEDEDQSTAKQASLPNLPLPLNNLPLMNYFQDLIRTNGHIFENIFQSRRLPSFLPHPYFLNNPFPPLPGPPPSLPSFPYHFSAPKKRRTKVTDTRLSPRITSKMPSDDSTDDENSSDGTPNQSIEYNGFQIILTPVHLRKAKLMFFYTRYPSSSVLKVYFPDVKFDKVITSQLVKWFSNFREFFYQQIEKTARQYLAEGIQNPDDLVVTTNSELYRALNIHYNRSNQINVPISFLTATQCALREFFLAIQQQKDLDSSWKKSIYKIMQRLDDQIPELFKNDHWMHSI